MGQGNEAKEVLYGTVQTGTPQAQSNQITPAQQPSTPAAPQQQQSGGQGPNNQGTGPSQAQQPPRTQQQGQPTQRQLQAMRELMRKEQELKQKESQLTQKEQAAQEAEQMKALAKEKPLEFLQKVGVSYDELSRQVVQGGRPDPTQELKQEIQELKSRLTEQQKKDHEKQREEYLNDARNSVYDYLNSSDSYELIKATGSQEAVFQKILQHYEQTGDILSEDQAAQEVEENLSGVVDSMLKTSKVQQKLGGKQQTEGSQEQPAQPNTLDNSVSKERTDVPSDELLPEEESIARLAQQLKHG